VPTKNSENKTKQKKKKKLLSVTTYYKAHYSDSEEWNSFDACYDTVRRLRKASYCTGLEESPTDSDAPNAPKRRNYNEFYAGQTIGQGNYCIAREVTDTNLLILKPLDDDEPNLNEARAKFEFFQTVYPEHFSQLIIADDTYRLFVEKMPGIPYWNFSISDERSALKIYLTAIQELKRSHAKSIILIDLKADNILFNQTNVRSFLIDGGCSTKKDCIINPRIYANPAKHAKKHEYWHIAPECWSVDPVLAKESMDVYSLGMLMYSKMTQFINDDNKNALGSLLQNAIHVDPAKRATLEELEENIKRYLWPQNSLVQSSKTAPATTTATTATASQSGFFSKSGMQPIIHNPYGIDQSYLQSYMNASCELK
jgi:serine/threonine protein kinase